VWAETAVAAGIDRTAVFAGPAGELGVLMPIRVLPPCLACHGVEDALQAAVRAALAEGYPEDQATGFADGDLRGWFWVEVPLPQSSNRKAERVEAIRIPTP
jgi:hypothetical protein